MSVKQCQQVIDSAEFTEWLAYARLEPFGAPYDHVGLGMVSATIANVHRDSKTTQYRPWHFLPWLPRPPDRGQTVEEQQQILGMVVQASRTQQTPAV